MRICIFHLHNYIYIYTHTHIPYLNTLQVLGVKLNTHPTPVITNRPHSHTWKGVGNFFICGINDCPHGQFYYITILFFPPHSYTWECDLMVRIWNDIPPLGALGFQISLGKPTS
jgi:hypothetical protein